MSGIVQEFPVEKKRVKLLVKESFLDAVEASVDSSLFRHLFAEVDGEKKDILDAGLKSCAVYIARMLFWFKLIHDVHASVYETVQDMRESDWEEIDAQTAGLASLERGDVVLWEEKEQASGSKHFHLGIYIGNNEVVSHRDTTRAPVRHHLTYGTNGDGTPVRSVLSYFRKVNWDEGLAWRLS